MSLQAILNDVETCVRASAAHNAGTPEENAAMALLNDLATHLAARQKTTGKTDDKVFDTSKPRDRSKPLATKPIETVKPVEAPKPTLTIKQPRGKPSTMIELLEEPKPAPLPVLEVKDLSSQVARSRKPRSRMPGDYDPDSPMPVAAVAGERRVGR